MTNEDLAIKIQCGHSEYYNELWANCRKLLLVILRKKVKDFPLPNYIHQEDLEQEMYFALCKAVQAYDITKPYSFNSYLNYSVMNTLREMLPDIRIQEISYNQTATDSEGNETEFIDLMADERAAARFENVELTDIQRQVRQAVAELPYKERQAITLHELRGITYSRIAEELGVSTETIKERSHKGLQILRCNKELSNLFWEFKRHYSRDEINYMRAQDLWQYSEEHRAVTNSIEQRKSQGEVITRTAELIILHRAENEYIQEYLKGCCYKH